MTLPTPLPLGADDPLAAWMLAEARQFLARGHRPVFALNGPVGAGKSSLALQLQAVLASAGVQMAVASIDDAYLPATHRREAMAGNPFGVTRVPPGSHDPKALVSALSHWQQQPVSEGIRIAPLQLPRFDKTLLAGEGDRTAPWCGHAEAVLLEGWMLGCRPWDEHALLAEPLVQALTHREQQWLLRCNRALEAYQPLWILQDRLLVLVPSRWSLPRRWRFQAEARQRRSGGGWLSPTQLQNLVEATMKSLPPKLFQEPLLQQADWVRVLDGRRRCRWQGSGDAWRTQNDQASSPCSSATGYTKP